MTDIQQARDALDNLSKWPPNSPEGYQQCIGIAALLTELEAARAVVAAAEITAAAEPNCEHYACQQARELYDGDRIARQDYELRRCQYHAWHDDLRSALARYREAVS